MSANQHTGLTDRVRAELQDGPLSLTALVDRIGENRTRVRTALTALCGRLGGVAMVPWTKGRGCLYARLDWIQAEQRKRPAEPTRNGSGVVAVPCREREFKPLRRDPFAHQRLAMETR